jgi:outer membrane protein insertion porin family
MPKARIWLIWFLVILMSPAYGQMGGGGDAPSGLEKPRFREHYMKQGGLNLHRESGDKVVRAIRIVGNRQIETERILQLLRTRVDGFYNEQTAIADVRRLYEFRAFNKVKQSVEEDAQGGVVVTFIVEELPLISKVIFHGNKAMTDRELRGRAGIVKDDPLNASSIESTRRRLLDYYREEGFSQATIQTVIGYEGNPDEGIPADDSAVVFRISEGEKERIAKINFIGNTIVSGARLSKVIASRDPFFGVGYYIGNSADIKRIDNDVIVLTEYYRNLGYLTATVDRTIEYDDSMKWITIDFIIKEGPRYTVNEIRLVGNKFIDTSSLEAALQLEEGKFLNGTLMNTDVSEITYAYGSLGFIYAEVTPELRWLEGPENRVDVVYKIEEGDRWKVGQIFVKIEGEPNLMRETTMLNYLDLVEGQYIDRRTLEMNRRRLVRSELLETNPVVADPPDLVVVPQDEAEFGKVRR